MPERLDARQIYITEGREMRPFDVKKCATENLEEFREFYLDVVNGGTLPDGVTLGDDGVLRGVPRMGTSISSPFNIVVDVNDESYQVPLELRVGAQLRPEDISGRQGKIWKALHESGQMPAEFMEFVDRPISKLDVYHLVERFATFTVWNADDRQLATTGKAIKVREGNDKFTVYDFDVCLVSTPKDLFADNRTLKDAYQTARSMVREAHRRRWHVEFGGFDKMANMAWADVQELNARSRHKMEIRNYTPPGVDATQTAGLEDQPEPE